MISQFVRNDVDKLFYWYEKSNVKTRGLKKLLFSSGDQFTVSIVIFNYNYIWALYNSADFTMLVDFEEIKDKLSIVNKVL